MKIIETVGIVLKTMDFKEKDNILTFLTRDAGKKAGVLHGGKSIRSGNAAKAELFVINHFEYSEVFRLYVKIIRNFYMQTIFRN
jgi:DNA repair protein RecO